MTSTRAASASYGQIRDKRGWHSATSETSAI